MTRSRDTASIIPTVDAKGDLLVGTANNAIDNLPAGTNGTYLKANSESATGLEWATGVESIVDAKGDLLVGTADNTVDNLSPGTNGQVLTANSATITGLEWTTPASTGNVIINGGMDISQRGNTTVTGADAYGALDRWKTRTATGGGSIASSRTASGLMGIPSAGRFQRPSGNTDTGDLRIIQILESVMSAPLAGQPVTLSFYARASANFSPTSSRITAVVDSGTGTDQTWFGLSGQASVISSQATLSTSWQRFVFTASVPANSNQLVVSFVWNPTGTAGANDWFEITGVQLEAGTVATPFRRNAPSIQAELAACQRYFQRFQGGTGCSATGIGISENAVILSFSLPTPMRTTVSANISGQIRMSDQYVSDPIANPAALDVLQGPTNLGGRIVVAGFSGVVTGRFYSIPGNGTGSGFIDFSAEL